MNPLSWRAVTKTYPSFRLGPVSLELPRGYVTGLVGANGAGKTTLIKTGLGMVHVSSGTVQRIGMERIGIVFDTLTSAPYIKVRDYVAAISRFYPAWDQATYDRLAAWASLDPAKKCKDLSRGMGMKLQLAIALSHGAELLVLDEATAGLDPVARAEFLDMLAEFMTDESHTVLFSTHITSDLDKIADYVVFIENGQVAFNTPHDELTDTWRLVRGPREELDSVRDLVHGLREHTAGWEGLLATQDTVGLRTSVVEKPTLEDIIVHLAKEPLHV